MLLYAGKISFEPFFLNTEQSFAGFESSTFTILINTASNLPTLQSLKPGDFRKKALKN